MKRAPDKAATTLFRFVQRQARSIDVVGRARMVWPSSQRSKSSASAAAELYRAAGSLARHLRQITSRSRGTVGFRLLNEGGSVSRESRRVSSGVSPTNGGRPVSNSYRIAP